MELFIIITISVLTGLLIVALAELQLKRDRIEIMESRIWELEMELQQNREESA